MNAEELHAAEHAQAAAEAFNTNVDTGRQMFLAFLPMDRIPGPIAPLTDRGIEALTERLLHRPTGQVDAAEHQVNIDRDHMVGRMRLLVADADLSLAIRDEVDGTADERQLDHVATAEQVFGTEHVDALRAMAGGDADVELGSRPPENMAVWASYVDSELVGELLAEHGAQVPAEPQALWP